MVVHCARYTLRTHEKIISQYLHNYWSIIRIANDERWYTTRIIKVAALHTAGPFAFPAILIASWTICRIKDLSTYLIYLSLVLRDRRRCRFRCGGGDDLLRSIGEWKFEKTPASTKRRGALNILPGRTATYPRPAGGFCPGTFVRSFRITRTPISCGRKERRGLRGVLSRGTIRKRNEGDLAGVDEWLFIAAENIPVIRLLSMEKRNSRTRVSNGDVPSDVNANFFAWKEMIVAGALGYL